MPSLWLRPPPTRRCCDRSFGAGLTHDMDALHENEGKNGHQCCHCLSLPFLVLCLHFHCLPSTFLHFHCLSLTFHCLSLTCHCLSLASHCLQSSSTASDGAAFPQQAVHGRCNPRPTRPGTAPSTGQRATKEMIQPCPLHPHGISSVALPLIFSPNTAAPRSTRATNGATATSAPA